MSVAPEGAWTLTARTGGRVNIVTALRAEAAPLIERFRLEAVPREAGLRRYSSRDAHLELTVSGVGKVASGAAVVAAARGRGDAAWLNVGIAGHADLEIGSAVLASKITDAASGRSWYPPSVFNPGCARRPLRTVDRSRHEYPERSLYDMEASGFYGIAARFATHELIQCFKVVSDNQAAPPEALDAGRVGDLIGSNLPIIDHLIVELGKLAAQRARLTEAPPGYARILGAARFTVTQRRDLRRLLRRWKLLLPGRDPVSASRSAVNADESRSARAGARIILEALDEHLATAPVRFEPGS